VNVRDVGGHRSAFGAEVAPGRVLRGDALSRLPQADIEKLGAVGLRTGQALHQLRGALLDQLHLVPLRMIIPDGGNRRYGGTSSLAAPRAQPVQPPPRDENEHDGQDDHRADVRQPGARLMLPERIDG